MKIIYKNDSVVITLPDAINLNNVSEFERDLLAVDIPSEKTKIILDAISLEYISSLGLRVFLIFRKRYDKNEILIDNVNNLLLEIFTTTGFSEFFAIRKRLKYVDVTNLEILGTGAIGKVYKLNDEQVLKVFIDGRSRETIDEELVNIRTALVNGIPTIIPFGTVETNEGFGFVFELVMSDLLAVKISENPENIPDYARRMADLMKSLCHTRLDTSVIKNVSASIESDFEEIECLVTPEDKELIKRVIRAVPEKNTCIHGDMHAGNIMLMDGKMTLIDMDDFGYGHPVWDMAQLVAVYQRLINEKEQFRMIFSLPDDLPYEAFVTKICHLSSEHAVKLFDCLKACYFESITDEDRENRLLLSEIYSDIIILRYIYKTIQNKTVNDEILDVKKRAAKYYIDDLKRLDISKLPKLFESWD